MQCRLRCRRHCSAAANLGTPRALGFGAAGWIRAAPPAWNGAHHPILTPTALGSERAKGHYEGHRGDPALWPKINGTKLRDSPDFSGPGGWACRGLLVLARHFHGDSSENSASKLELKPSLLKFDMILIRYYSFWDSLASLDSFISPFFPTHSDENHTHHSQWGDLFICNGLPATSEERCVD